MSNKRLVIVGGVAGGASAAARARRLCEDCKIIIFERGPHVSFANCGLPYFVGGEIAEQDSLLVQTPESLKARFNLDVRINTEVVRIDRSARSIRVRALKTGREYDEAYDALILSIRWNDSVAPEESVAAGSTQLWEFVNLTNPMGMQAAHPIHMHGRQFRVVARNGGSATNALRAGIVDAGWRDTVLVLPGETVRVQVTFTRHPGLYLYHCHILEHEDMGMMRNFQVT